MYVRGVCVRVCACLHGCMSETKPDPLGRLFRLLASRAGWLCLLLQALATSDENMSLFLAC